MDIFGTHLPVLMTFAARSNGPILELGCGDNSTLTLHAFCRQRMILSVDNDPSFINRYQHLIQPMHRFHFVPDWSEFDVRDLGPVWEIALVDHAPFEQRLIDMDRLRDHAKFIILHDAHAPEYQEILSSFKHRLDYTRLFPQTTVVSDIADPQDVWRD